METDKRDARVADVVKLILAILLVSIPVVALLAYLLAPVIAGLTHHSGSDVFNAGELFL